MINKNIIDDLLSKHDEYSLYKEMAPLVGYEICPPSIDDFIYDTHFLGEFFKRENDPSDDSIYLIPIWLEGLRDIFPNPFWTNYSEIIFTGAIGQGKSTIAKIGMAYDICRALCLRSPQAYFGTGKSKKILFVYLNATLDLSKQILVDEVLAWFSGSPFFKEHMMKSTKDCTFDKRIHVVFGSRGTHAMGGDVAGALLSELNFQNKIANQAYENYTNVKRRITSRFLPFYSKTKTYPGRIWLDSSRKDTADFLDEHINKARKDPGAKVFDYTLWDILKYKMDYSGEVFKVFVGSKSRDPFIVDNRSVFNEDDQTNIIEVPVEHRKDFEDDLFNAIRDIAGKGTWSSFVFITSHAKISESLSRDNLIDCEEVQLDFYDEEDQLINYIDISKILNDRRPRFIHIDIGTKKDRTGIACTRLDGYIETQRINYNTGKHEITRDPKFTTEFVIPVSPKPGSELPIYKFKTFILNLRQNELPIASVSADGWQSLNLIQDLKLLGFDACTISVDRTRNPYDFFKSLILEQRWSCAYNSILENELQNLVDLGDKIDHPKVGSKDVSDSCCGSLENAYNKLDKFNANYSMSDYIQTLSKSNNSNKGIYNKLMRYGR